MYRFLTIPALLSVAGVCSAQQAPLVQVEVQVQVAQQQPAVVQVQVGDVAVPTTTTPAKPGAKTEFKPAADASPDPKSLVIAENLLLKAKELVKQLGSASYRERENASREITKLGRSAYAPLKTAALEEANPEIRLRVDILLPGIEAAEMEARVACFMKDLEGKFEHDLPGWNKFRVAAGNDRSARELFGEVLKNKVYHALLLASELPANELGGMLNNHFMNMQNAQNNNMQFRRGGYIAGQPSVQEIAVLVFLESLYSDKDLGMNYNFGYTVANYMHTTDIQNAMQNGRGTGKYGPPLKKLVTQWLETRETSNGAQMAMNYATNWQLPNKLKYAAKVLVAPTENGNWWVKQQALLAIGQANNKESKEYIPQIAKCFDDSTVIQQQVPGNGTNPTVLLQDFALGVALQITAQKPKDYGMDVMSTAVNWNHNNFYFKDDKTAKAEDKRKAAFKKWTEWEAAGKKEQKKDEPKKEETKTEDPKKELIENNVPATPPGLAPLPQQKRPIE
jgi:hypothetical protein